MNTSTSRWLLHRAARPGEMTGDVPQPLMLLSRIGGSCHLRPRASALAQVINSCTLKP
jgi:hypothetical protein